MILKDLLDVNSPTGGAIELERQIRHAIGTTMRITDREVRLLEQAGFVVTNGGKHFRATYGNDPRLRFTLYKTASDHRSPMNLVSQITRKLLK